MTSTTHTTVTIAALLESGAHFGHQKNRWNPKMRRYIYEERNGIYLIDLAKTMQQIRQAIQVITNVVSSRKNILFVGTKKQAKSVIKECAEQCGEFYVSERWLGGMLTNLATIRQSVKRLERIEKELTQKADELTKKEQSVLNKDRIKLDRNLSGVRAMRKPPGLIIIVDPGKEHIAVAEANALGIPILSLVDTNCDPDPIDHIVACNDDALKSIKLILTEFASVISSCKKEFNVGLVQKHQQEASDIAKEETTDTDKEKGDNE